MIKTLPGMSTIKGVTGGLPAVTGLAINPQTGLPLSNQNPVTGQIIPLSVLQEVLQGRSIVMPDGRIINSATGATVQTPVVATIQPSTPAANPLVTEAKGLFSSPYLLIGIAAIFFLMTRKDK